MLYLPSSQITFVQIDAQWMEDHPVSIWRPGDILVTDPSVFLAVRAPTERMAFRDKDGYWTGMWPAEAERMHYIEV